MVPILDGKINFRKNPPLPDILYIMGTGRSGTTLLEILLRNSPGIFGAGEVAHIVRDGFVRNRLCSCGNPTLGCPVWSDVRGSSSWGAKELDMLVNIFRTVEGHKNFFRLALGRINDATIRAYQAANERLFLSIKTATAAHAIVDSSKYAGRALALTKLFGQKVRVICVTRSPASVIVAFGKPNKGEQLPKTFLGATVYYVYVLFCMWIVRRQLRDFCLLVRYEDLQAHPVETVTRIQDWSGFDFTETKLKLSRNEWFDVGHIVTGNRLRKQGKVRLLPGANINRDPDCGVTGRFVIKLLDVYRRALRF